MRTPSPRKYYQNPEYLHSAHQYNGKCVCQICQCDNPDKRHKCPQPGFRLQTETTTQHFYKPHAISPQKYYRKKYEPNSTRYEPSDLVTNYKDTYRPHDLNHEGLRPRTAKPEYSPSKFKFEGETEYKTKYSPLKIKTEPSNLSPRKNKEYLPSPFKFEGETTYKAQYSPKKCESPSRRKKQEYSPSKFSLQSQTTYNNFYKAHKLQPSDYNQRQPKNTVTFNANKQKFEGQTRYREFYTPREVKPVRRCPADVLPQRPYRCSPDKKHTYFHAEGNRWE